MALKLRAGLGTGVRWRLLAALGALLALGLIAGLWYGLPVRSVQVTGNHFLSAAEVARLAGAQKNFGWLFYGKWRAGALERSPWVLAATITRVFPGTVQIDVTERVPVARLVRDGHEQMIAADGVVLPGAPPRGPRIAGWGPDRSSEALGAARLLARYTVGSVDYTPSGLTVKTASGTLWSGSLLSLQKYAAGVTMNPGKRVNIYPWGVSVQE